MTDEGQNPYAPRAVKALEGVEDGHAQTLALLAIAWELRKVRLVMEPIAEALKSAYKDVEEDMNFTANWDIN